tara:strand:- start:540 stop:2738 length:2199 start_codon:yes stop_codon:yes gene_type:complete
MAKQGISTGTTPNDGTGDSLLGGAVKINSNFDEVYGKLGDGTNLFVGIVSSIAVDGALSISTSYGAPTITGTANTAVVNARQIYSAGIVTFASDASIAGVNTFSSAGYDVAGIVTAQQVSLYDSATVAGITTVDSYGINVTGVGTFSNIAVRGNIENSVGVHSVFIDQTGIAATTLTISDTATIGIASVTTSHVTTANLTTANINSGIITSAVVGSGVSIYGWGIDASGIVTATSFTGNVTGTATTATLAVNAQGLTGSPNINCGIITGTNLHATGGSGANISGVCTASSFSVGANAVVTAARKLSNIASLDATTTATIESAIEATPNDFTDLNVAGLATVGQLYINGRTNGLNIIGVTTGLSVSGVTTVGIVTGATSIQVTDVYSNFLYGDGSNLTGIAVTDNITTSGIATFADALNVTTTGVSTFSGVANVAIATITDLNVSGFATATTFVGQLDSGIGTITKAFIGAGVTIDQKNIDAGQTGIVTAATFSGNLTGTPTLGTGVTVTTWGLEVLGVTTSTTFSGNVNSGVATITTGTITTGTVTNLTGTTATIGAVTINATGVNNSGVSTASSFVGNITGDVTGNIIGTPTLGTGVTNTTGGLVVGAGKSYTGDSSRVISGRWILGANGTSDYTFTGVGFTATENDPDLYLARGNTYQFVNASGGHPFRIQSTQNGSTGAAYGSGVINNDGGDGSTITFEVPFNAPDTLYYQCTAHTGMGGTIFIYPALR